MTHTAKRSGCENADVEEDNGSADDCDREHLNKCAYEFNLMKTSSILLYCRF